MLDTLKDTLKSGHLYKACFLLKGSSKWKFLCIISRWCLVCYRKCIRPNLNLMRTFRKFGCAMRFNSLRVEQGVDHLISPLDGAMPVNLKEMNLKQLKALTSILTDLAKVKDPTLTNCHLCRVLQKFFRVRIKSRFLCEDENGICSYIQIKNIIEFFILLAWTFQG